MPRGSIPAQYYAAPEVYAQEIEQIFRRCWMFAGFAEDVAKHNDFLTLDLPGHSVVIQNFRGELRALRNVCSHRFARIQHQPCGNRPLVCPYHGWSYNQDGVPFGIPDNEASFGLDREARQQLALPRYELEACGRFLFVRLTPGGEDLKSFLGAYYDELLHCSELFTDAFETVEPLWNCNWKIGYENAGEGYHLNHIHPESFAPVFDEVDLRIDLSGDHAAFTADISQRSIRWWATAQRHMGIDRSERFPGYRNYCLFPNVVLTMTNGTFLTVQTLEPVGPDQCRLRSRGLLARRDGRPAREAVRKGIEGELRRISDMVREEDRVIAEQVHRGAREMSGPPMLGVVEGRLSHFQAAYMRWMGEGPGKG